MKNLPVNRYHPHREFLYAFRWILPKSLINFRCALLIYKVINVTFCNALYNRDTFQYLLKRLILKSRYIPLRYRYNVFSFGV